MGFHVPTQLLDAQQLPYALDRCIHVYLFELHAQSLCLCFTATASYNPFEYLNEYVAVEDVDVVAPSAIADLWTGLQQSLVNDVYLALHLFEPNAVVSHVSHYLGGVSEQSVGLKVPSNKPFFGVVQVLNEGFSHLS